MRNKQKTLPSSIQPCPIIDALVEIRFVTKVNPNAVFGLAYGALMHEYPGDISNLPIMQLPEAVRNSDPSFKFKPQYRLLSKDVIIQIGPEVLSISSSLPYVGWELFKSHVIQIINLINSAGIIKRVIRLGHRYINFFDTDMLHNITMTFNMTEGYNIENIQITTSVKDYTFDNTIQFSNSSVINFNQPDEKRGSSIDIDTYKNYSDHSFLNNIANEIEDAHKCEKTLFFSLLKESFIEKLNPRYD